MIRHHAPLWNFGCVDKHITKFHEVPSKIGFPSKKGSSNAPILLVYLFRFPHQLHIGVLCEESLSSSRTWLLMLLWRWRGSTTKERSSTPSTLSTFSRHMAAAPRKVCWWMAMLSTAQWLHRVSTVFFEVSSFSLTQRVGDDYYTLCQFCFWHQWC